jgi:hypothetical protein
MNEQEVRDLLDDLAQTPAPRTRVDLVRAVAVGRRRARARALAPAAASVLVVCGLAGGITFAVTDIDRSPPATDVSSPPASAAPATSGVSAVSAPARFDPLVRFASFGWLPETPKPPQLMTVVTAERFSLDASDSVPDPANGPGAWQPGTFAVNVYLYAAGVVPRTGQPFEVQTPEGPATVQYGPMVDAPSVNGQPAQWVGVPGGDDHQTILRWRYARDAWAEVYLSELDGDRRQAALRIASTLRIGGTERLRFPFHVTGLPVTAPPVSSQISEEGSAQPWQVTLDFGGQPGGAEPRLSIVAQPNSEPDREVNTTVDGHQARRYTADGEHLGVPQHFDQLSVYGVAGLKIDVYIDARSAADAKVFGPDGALSVYRQITVLADPSSWTDQPVR